MSKLREKIFVHVVSNIAILLAVIAVFAVSFSGRIVTAINQEKGKPYYHGDEKLPQVSLMINVYWGTEYIDEMLNILERNDAKCTFFVGGSWAMKNPEVLIKIYEKGHEIANHGHFHKEHNKLSLDKNREEISRCEEVVKKIIGYKMNLFAPPSGAFSKDTLLVSEEMGYKTIMWTRDTIDWRDKDTNIVYQRATKNPKNGDLILMHPTEHTKNALDRILKFFSSEGMKVVTVTQNLNL